MGKLSLEQTIVLYPDPINSRAKRIESRVSRGLPEVFRGLTL